MIDEKEENQIESEGISEPQESEGNEETHQKSPDKEPEGWDIPTDDAPDEHWTKFREGLRPEKVEDYDFGDAGKENPDVLSKMKEIFWESGIPKRMAKDLLEKIGTYELEYTQSRNQNMQEIIQRAEDDLGKGYKGGTERINQILLNKITEEYGAEDAESVLQSLTGNIAAKKLLLDTIMNTSNNNFVKGDTSSETPDDKLRKLRHDDKFMTIARDKTHRDYNKHNDMIAELAYDIEMEKQGTKKENQ